MPAALTLHNFFESGFRSGRLLDPERLNLHQCALRPVTLLITRLIGDADALAGEVP